MFVLLEGLLQGRGELGGETFVFQLKAGDVTGLLPFSRMKQFTVSGRAETDSRAPRFPSSLFPELVQKMPELTERLVGLMSDRIRETTRMNNSGTGWLLWGNFPQDLRTNSTTVHPPRNAPPVNCATF